MERILANSHPSTLAPELQVQVYGFHCVPATRDASLVFVKRLCNSPVSDALIVAMMEIGQAF
jgi:hypothetical protein